MRRSSRALAVSVAFLWLLAGPIAMAFGGCGTMAAMCEAPCGLGSCALLLTTVVIVLAMIAALPRPAAESAPFCALSVLELPPRSSLRFA